MFTVTTISNNLARSNVLQSPKKTTTKKHSLYNSHQLSDLRFLTCCTIWMTLHKIIWQLASEVNHTDCAARLTLNDEGKSGNLNLPEATEAPKHYLTRTTL